MWQQETPIDTYTWQEALTHCNDLTLAGYSDWRLPTRNELQSLVDYSQYYPAIDTDLFPGHCQLGLVLVLVLVRQLPELRVVRGFQRRRRVATTVRATTTTTASGRCEADSLGHLVIWLFPFRGRGDTYQANDPTPLTIQWNDQGISGDVEISLSREGGKDGTFETIGTTQNSAGSYDWTVTGSASVNCVMRIMPQNDPGKSTEQGLFSIDATAASEPTSSASGLNLSEPTTGSLALFLDQRRW